MRKLDEIALNVELVLISIIEGVALTSLAAAALPVFSDRFSFTGLLFVLSGLLLLLVFWSQAILHAVSFIRWPLRMEHMLTYFVAAFLQVIAYNNLTNSVAWFFWWSIFSLLVLGIYFIDLRVIKQMMPFFGQTPGGMPYIEEVMRRHLFELRVLVPLSVVFNLVAFGLAYLFELNDAVIFALACIQFLISFGALFDCVRNFGDRSDMLPALFPDHPHGY